MNVINKSELTKWIIHKRSARRSTAVVVLSKKKKLILENNFIPSANENSINNITGYISEDTFFGDAICDSKLNWSE